MGDLLDEFGGRSFAPFFIIVPLLEISPLGGIPGVPTVLAAIIMLFAVQMLLGHDHVWLPDFMQRRAMSGDKLLSGAEKLEGVAVKLDKLAKGRFGFFTKDWAHRVVAMFIIALACTVPPLEFIPFASTGPMLAIAVFGLALLVRDGLLVIVAVAASVAAVVLGLTVWNGSGG